MYKPVGVVAFLILGFWQPTHYLGKLGRSASIRCSYSSRKQESPMASSNTHVLSFVVTFAMACSSRRGCDRADCSLADGSPMLSDCRRLVARIEINDDPLGSYRGDMTDKCMRSSRNVLQCSDRASQACRSSSDSGCIPSYIRFCISKTRARSAIERGLIGTLEGMRAAGALERDRYVWRLPRPLLDVSFGGSVSIFEAQRMYFIPIWSGHCYENVVGYLCSPSSALSAEIGSVIQLPVSGHFRACFNHPPTALEIARVSVSERVNGSCLFVRRLESVQLPP